EDGKKESNSLFYQDTWGNQIGEPNANEVMVNHLAVDEDGKKESNSLFYQDTWGNTCYDGLAVLSIENLQFIAMDNRLGHQSVRFNQNAKKPSVKEDIEDFLITLIGNLKKIAEQCGMSQENIEKISATHDLFIKPGSLFTYPEEGILLNNEAIHALVLETQRRLNSFSIIKSKGFVRTENVVTNLTTEFQCSGLDMPLTGDIVPDYACFYVSQERQAQEA
ncbi:hypothetical protein CS022_22260, partial [Veronia nyctiphanis]